MKFLFDSHLLIWAASGSNRMPKHAVTLLNNKSNEIFFSSASLWEISIKAARGSRGFQVDPRLLLRNLLDNDFTELPLTSRHGIAVLGLPGIHKDPFDRLLIAQAITEGITLLTSDATVMKYPGPIQKV
jgi:PIN domain nuclease of toxin-antitoxin system